MPCHFQEKWLDDPNFNSWLAKVQKHAFCRLCKKNIDISTMGKSALTSHSKGQKHINNLSRNRMKVCAITEHLEYKSTARASTTTCDNPKSCDSPTVNLVDQIHKTETLEAELLWSLHSVSTNHSFHSNEGISKLFTRMFPDSETAKNFTCGETKTMYLTNFGIAPHFSDLMLKKVRNDSTVLLFDESLNKELQKKQMDIFVRFWDDNTINSRYLTSHFLGHACATDLLSTFETCVADKIGLHNIVSVSMDGPNVNWAAFQKLENKIENELDKKLINVGSCGLHTLHNAFKAGVSATTFDISKYLSSLHRLFDDVPARREDFESCTKSECFPLPFCNHRWVENVRVCERALKVLPFVKEYVQCVRKKIVKDPKTQSFENVKEMCSDPLTKAKLEFVIAVAKPVEGFLTKYQTDAPMLPFLAKDLGEVLRTLLSRFVTDRAMDEASNLQKLIHMKYEESLKAIKQIDIGFVVEQELKSAVEGKKVSELQVLEFRSNCQSMLKALVSKLLSKSPLTYSLVRNLSCLDPQEICSGHNVSSKFKRVLNVLHGSNRVDITKCDEILDEYVKFVNDVKHSDKSEFEAFRKFKCTTTSPDSDCSNKERLDTLYYNVMLDGQYKHLFVVFKLLLLLSHGQASVERGFSVNKEVSVNNMSEETLKARRVIKDTLDHIGGLDNLVVTKELKNNARHARQKYLRHLEEQKREKVQKEKGEKRKALEQEIDKTRKKMRNLSDAIKTLNGDADKSAEKAEQLHSFAHITKSNGLRNKAKEKQIELEKMQKLLDEKVHLLSNL